MAIKKRKNSPYYWARFYVHGREYFLSTGTSVYREARSWETARKAELEKQGPAAPIARGKSHHTLKEVAALDIDRAVAVGVDPNTIKTYHENHWRLFCDFFGMDGDPSEITSHRVMEYVNHRRKVGIKGQTIRKELPTLKRGLLLAKQRGWLNSVPDEWPRIKSEKKSESLSGKYREPALVQKWLDALPDRARDEALFALMTGLRWKEIRRIRADRVERMPKGSPVPAILRLRPEDTKGKYERIVGLTQDALDLIERVAAREPRPSDGTLFGPNQKSAHRRTSLRLGIRPCITMRDLRHTHASLALAQGADLKGLMTSMGHKDLAMAARYQHSTVVRTASAAAAAVRRFKAEKEHNMGAQRHKNVQKQSVRAKKP